MSQRLRDALKKMRAEGHAWVTWKTEYRIENSYAYGCSIQEPKLVRLKIVSPDTDRFWEGHGGYGYGGGLAFLKFRGRAVLSDVTMKDGIVANKRWIQPKHILAWVEEMHERGPV